MQACSDNFDFAGGQIGIGFAAEDDLALHSHHKFRAGLFGFRVRFGLRFFVEDYLHDARAIADVQEEKIAQVTAARYPAHDDHIAASVAVAQRSAIVCAF